MIRAALALALPALALAGAATAARGASLEVIVEGIVPAPGSVYVALCQGGLSGAACPFGEDAPAGAGAQRFVFANVPAGVWAVAAYHDLNGNGRLDRTRLGLPLEPYGLSGEVGRRARPDFAQARFVVDEPVTRVRVRLARALPPR